MKLVYKICLVNVGIAFLIPFIFILPSRSMSLEEYFIFLGMVSLVGGAIDIFIGAILFAIKKTQWAQGYFLTAGILLLLGFISCSPAWIT